MCKEKTATKVDNLATKNRDWQRDGFKPFAANRRTNRLVSKRNECFCSLNRKIFKVLYYEDMKKFYAIKSKRIGNLRYIYIYRDVSGIIGKKEYSVMFMK